MSDVVFRLSVFGAISLGIIGLVSLIWEIYFRRRSLIAARIKQESRQGFQQKVSQSTLFRDFADVAAEIAGSRPTWSSQIQTFVSQSGTNLTVNHLVLSTLMGGVGLAIASWVIADRIILVVPATVVGACVPWVYVFIARKRRMTKLCQQLPEAFDVMSRALRAGQTVQATFQIVADDFSAPISDEFAYCGEQQHLGIPFDVAVRQLAQRTGFAETLIFSTALIINRKAGGNLAEMLSNLAATMRNRRKFKSRVHALTGEGRMQAIVLTALPIIAMVALLILNRSYAQVLLDRPKILAGAVVSQLLGAACIQKITNFKY